MNRRWRILLAADDAAVRAKVEARLREEGYTLDVACSGMQAVELARKAGYAICVLDLQGDEIATLAQVRQLRPEAYIIATASHEIADVGVPAAADGMLEYVRKPSSAGEVGLRVRRIITIKNLQRENATLRKMLTRRPGGSDMSAGMSIQEMENLLIAATLHAARGNVKETASRLGIDRSTLYEKIKRYQIRRP